MILTLNGFYILAIVVVAGIYYWLGYSCGKWDTEKKWNGDVMAMSERINQILKKYESPYRANPDPTNFNKPI